MRRSATVIVTHDRDELLPEVITAHLAELEAPDDLIVVVDCASRVPATDVVPRDERVRIVRSDENLGPAGGFALGMDAALDAGADDLWLCNDDDLPIPGARRRLRALLHEHGPHALVGGLCLRPDGSVIGYGWTWHHGVRPVPPPSDGTTLVDSHALPFTGLFVTRETVQLAGPVRADYFMMGEEHEFCLRCVDGGARVLLELQPAIRFKAGATHTHYPPWRGYYQARNNVRLALARGGWRSTIRTVLRQLKLLVGAATIAEGRWARVAFRVRGLVDGFRGISGRTVEPR